MTLLQWMDEHPRLFSEWDGQANAHIPLESTSHGSHKRAWWICERGHRWEAYIYSRTGGGKSCPYCSGKRVLEGFNDLQSTSEGAMELWDFEKNSSLDPKSLSKFSHKSAWWTCARGHSWQAAIYSVAVNGTGCPYCSGARAEKGFNDLESERPQLALQWLYEKNAASPDSVTSGSRRLAHWRCEKGHEWSARIDSRSGSQKAKCPYCSNYLALEGFNDLKTTHPSLASEWCDELNGELKPTAVTAGAHKRVWWKCSEGHVWEAYVFARAKENGTGCPVCAGKVKMKEHEAQF